MYNASNHKKFINILTIWLLATTSIFCQDKRDYQWFFGIDQDPSSGFRALKFDFNNQPFTPETRDKGLRFDRNNVSICDKNGSLLLYSNGCAIANREHEVMVNGDNINAGEFFDDHWSDGTCSYGYPGRQDILILEDPAEQEGYYVIHKRLVRAADGDWFDIQSLTYSYVDLTLDNGLGAVTEKNVDFYTIDEFLWSYLTAIYQSNGKDWWLINPGLDGNFYVFSIDNDGLNLNSIQDAFHTFDPINASAGGDAKFSPDGTRYAYFNHTDGLLLYNFDRDTGQLSDVRKLDIPIVGQVGFATCEWSPNSEFLYLATGDTLWQVEVAFDNLEDGKVFIAEYNGVRDPFSTRFFLSTLGPDCKIYIRPGSSSYSFHVIHMPNKKGVACNLEQQGIKLPEVSSTGGFPNFPRFRVDEEEKCDPSISNVFGEAVYWKRALKVYPNPASAIVTIEIPDNTLGDVYVFNILGQVVLHQQGLCGEVVLDISLLAAGSYVVDYIPKDNEDRLVYTQQLIKVD